ncbi:hypothetical protein BJ878DRAFT_497473 [Calycina marina]|uniref:Antifreeze protein n=1 Tax=Calycina marina TaxID=1763456 RepID=A0A9P8CGK2_9HELO|nr:hypothetical protein BJ878DRAFT_497473 [Calycina marina]
MRFSLLTLAASAAAFVSAQDSTMVCNRNNCLRAVIASSHSPGPAVASADCISFLASTVTPVAVRTTSISYITVTDPTITVTAAGPLSTPAYATACSGTIMKYASACSCIGVTASIVTLAIPSNVVTSTSIITVVPAVVTVPAA